MTSGTNEPYCYGHRPERGEGVYCDSNDTSSANPAPGGGDTSAIDSADRAAVDTVAAEVTRTREERIDRPVR